MPELQIIGAPQSNYVCVVRIACLEKGVPYTLVPATPHSPEVDAIHPDVGRLQRIEGRERTGVVHAGGGPRVRVNSARSVRLRVRSESVAYRSVS